ncbi:microfibrillar-associated protein 1-like [Panicum miliaceum]|uniref:Microfibrillar-associated protein 1-like n=1 Tax=Panicum miliaceum TaxID=4540 RepID=A0A3L6S2Q4_PANMI|nr:microfibrillar-associated protein 1-like [Panicum miliaceum]
MSALAGVCNASIAVRDRFRGKIGLTRVRRYRRGMLPEWASDLDDDEDLNDGDDETIPRTALAASVLGSVSPRRHSAATARDDRRCVRLHGEVVSAAEEEAVEPRDAEVDAAAAENDEAQEERRRRIRERLLLREREEAELLPKEDEELPAEMESGSESEHEADSGEEETCIAVVKPVFVPKPRRDTVVERERIEEERRLLEELVRRRMEERKAETRRIVVEVIIKDENIHNEEPVSDTDTDDDADEAKEYEAWKNREIERIRRDREAGLRKGESEKVRNMTGKKRMEYETGNPKPLAKRKRMMKFMQRYYHKGAFFQKADDGSQMSGLDDVYKRDFSTPTGEDRTDMSILPKVMEVKKFGRSGRVKWTHLVDEDTTVLNNSYVLSGYYD